MKDIGKKIKSLREKHGFSQELFATKLGIKRSTLSQIENGERKLYAEEISKISDILGVSADIILEKHEEKKIIIETEQAKEPKQEQDIRISVPRQNIKKFKEVLLYLLKKVGAKPNIGETVIYKILYFIDFDFYEKFEEQLIGATYQRNRHGPTPLEFKKITDDMIKNNELEKVKSIHFNYPQTKYLPLREPDLSVLNANEIKLIDAVLHRLSDMNTKQISDYSHGDIPWLTTEEQEIIDYESVFYRTELYSMRRKTHPL